MGIVADVLEALSQIPVWKRVVALPQEHEALKARVAALERRLDPATGDLCPRCKEPTFMLIDSSPMSGRFGRLDVTQRRYRCSSCQYQEARTLPRGGT